MRILSQWSIITENQKCWKRPEKSGSRRWSRFAERECGPKKSQEVRNYRWLIGISSKETASGTSASRILNSSRMMEMITQPSRKRTSPRRLWPRWGKSSSVKCLKLKLSQFISRASRHSFSSVETDKFPAQKDCCFPCCKKQQGLTNFVTKILYIFNKKMFAIKRI